jgi:hypothetical protein
MDSDSEAIMGNVLSNEAVNLIRSERSIKILATGDEAGSPHAVRREDFLVLDDGTIVFAEWRESSYTNRNLVHAIWNDKKVSLLVFDENGISVAIDAKPVRFDFFSDLYQKQFEKAREKHGDNIDVTGLWYLKPISARDEDAELLKKEEEELHPYFRYLDKPDINKTKQA